MSATPGRDAVNGFFSVVLVVFGGMWVLLAGGCAKVALFKLLEPGGRESLGEMLLVLAVLAVFAAPGAITAWAGWKGVRQYARRLREEDRR